MLARGVFIPLIFLGHSMTEDKNLTVLKAYQKISKWYNDNRSRDLFEKSWLDKAISHLNPKASILDLGCGMGEPIAQYFLDLGFKVTGVDGCNDLIKLAQHNLPAGNFLLGDMRELRLGNKFDFIIAWNSFFHLCQDDQRNMFNVFTSHLNTHGILMFTAGSKAGEAWSDNGGENLYHASLSPDGYKQLLKEYGFELIDYKINDKDCNNHTVWLAKYGKHL